VTAVLAAKGISVSFGGLRAVDEVDLEVGEGQLVGLIGPNGAGKTTFISAVATLVRLDGGELSVAGIDARSEPARVRRVIGLAGQSASVEPAMTGRENLEFTAGDIERRKVAAGPRAPTQTQPRRRPSSA
jgi:ABC-2 type transport system ATP-binding protein